MALSKNKLREYRERSGLSQEKLAGKAGVSRQTIISIEGGRYVPSLELALKFAKEFKCKVEDLFGLLTLAWVQAAKLSSMTFCVWQNTLILRCYLVRTTPTLLMVPRMCP